MPDRPLDQRVHPERVLAEHGAAAAPGGGPYPGGGVGSAIGARTGADERSAEAADAMRAETSRSLNAKRTRFTWSSVSSEPASTPAEAHVVARVEHVDAPHAELVSQLVDPHPPPVGASAGAT